VPFCVLPFSFFCVVTKSLTERVTKWNFLRHFILQLAARRIMRKKLLPLSEGYGIMTGMFSPEAETIF
ncbi:MAG: hypothetical protein ACFNUI_07775, partial [Negativicutes bacterium]